MTEAIRWGELTLPRAFWKDLGPNPFVEVLVWESVDGSARIEWERNAVRSPWKALRDRCVGWGTSPYEAIANCDHMRRLAKPPEPIPDQRPPHTGNADG
jgi:hypothetical protein